MYMYGMDELEYSNLQIDTMSDGLHTQAINESSQSYDNYHSEIHPDFEDEDVEIDDGSNNYQESEEMDDQDFIDQGRLSNLSDVKVFLEEVMCPICCHILVNPKTCRECDQAFCSRCIDRWFNKHNKQVCPCCRSSNDSYCLDHTTEIMSGKIPKILVNLLSKLLLTCKYQEDGCEEIVTYEFREKHETLYCQYQEVECENLGCMEIMIRKDMEEHILECEYGKVNCKYCSQDYFRRDIENHLQYCECRPVLCQWCKMKHQWVEFKNHLEECEFRKVTCEYCHKDFQLFEMKEHTPLSCQIQTTQKYKLLYEKQKHESQIKDERLAQQAQIIEELQQLVEQLKQNRRSEHSDANQSTQELTNEKYDEDFEDDEDEEPIEEDIQVEDEDEEQLNVKQFENNKLDNQQDSNEQDEDNSELEQTNDQPSILEIRMRGLYTSLLTRLNENNFKELWDWSEEDINQVLGLYQ